VLIGVFSITVTFQTVFAIEPVTSVTAIGSSGDDSILLSSITAGDYMVYVSNLATGTNLAEVSNEEYPPENSDNFNITSFAQSCVVQDIILFDDEVFRDANGDDKPDFFLFENGGDDSGFLQPIFTDDSFGKQISFCSGDFGDTGFISNLENQNIKALAFSITDLKDETGKYLTNDSVIKGIRVTSFSLDMSCVCAVVKHNPSLCDCPNEITHYWNFDNETEPNYPDVIGRSQAECIDCPNFVEGKILSAVEFGGSQKQMLLWAESNDNIYDALTILAWVYIGLPDDVANPIIAKQDSFILETEAGTNALSFTIVGESGTQTCSAKNPGDRIPANAWTFVAAAYDGSNIDLYLNSKPVVNEVALIDTFTECSGDYTIGSAYDVNSLNPYFFTGRIDDVAVLNRRLNDDEIAELFHKSLISRGYCGRSARDWPDLDNDCIVNFADSAVVSGDWLNSRTDSPGDIDADNCVDGNDLNILANYWLKDCNSLK